MDYKDAFIEALLNKELVENYDRLSGTSLGVCLKSMVTGGINYKVDLATGRIKEEIQKFDTFFFEYVWSRLKESDFEQNNN